MDSDSLVIGLLVIFQVYQVLGMKHELTITPNPVDEGGQVEITCSYTKEPTTFTTFLKYGETVVCSYFNNEFTVGPVYQNRSVHSVQDDYSKGITITLTNITIMDNGTYSCVVSENTKIDNQQTDLDVHVPPRSMQVSMASMPPYTEENDYNVICTFSAYPDTRDVLLSYAIIHTGKTVTRKTPLFTSVMKDGLFEITTMAPFTLKKEDNGAKNFRCEVTWRIQDRKYLAHLETPLNVTFSGGGLSSSFMLDENLILSVGKNVTWPACTWGSANPPKNIKWIVKNGTTTEDNIRDRTTLPSTTDYEPGEYNGHKTVSRLTVTRDLNQRNVSCCVMDEKLHCRRSGVLDVRFPPTEATITSGVPAAGKTLTLTCATNSSHPQSNITWDLPSQNDTIAPELIISAGDFGGNISTSILTFNVSSEDMGTPFTCRVMWNGRAILNRTHVIGAITTTPLVTSTTPQAASTTGDDIEGPHGANKRPIEDNTNLIIGLAVGLGGAVILITVILAVVIVRRKKRKQRQQDRAEPEPDYADIGNGNSYTETPVSDPPESPPETLSHDDEMPTYAQVNKSPSRRQKQQRGLPDVVSPGVKRDDDSDEEPEGPPVSERRRTELGEPAIVPAEAEQPPTDKQKRPEIKNTKPVVDKSKKPCKPGKKPGNKPEEIGDRTPNVVTQKSEPNYAEVNPSQKKNVVPTPTDSTEYGKVDFSQDHENDEDVTGDTDSD